MSRFAVIMAGGSGTRFWPKSSKKIPKQLLSLTGSQSQLQLTWSRLSGVSPKNRRLIVCTEELKKAILSHVPGAWILGEPSARNTMAAVCWSVWSVFDKDPEASVAVLPADAFIANVEEFKASLKRAYDLAENENRIVCLGIQPTGPATAYGYIRKGRPLGLGFQLQEFVEKPNYEKAKDFFESGEYLWNAGIFVFKAKLFIDEVRTHAPEFSNFFDSYLKSPFQLKKKYKTLTSISIDVALMEKTSRGALVSGNFGWNDLGSWPALPEVLPPNSEAGLVKAPGGFLSLGSKNNIADVSNKKFLALVGVENLIIVETEKALLVCHRDQSQDIKTIVSMIQKNKKWADRLL